MGNLIVISDYVYPFKVMLDEKERQTIDVQHPTDAMQEQFHQVSSNSLNIIIIIIIIIINFSNLYREIPSIKAPLGLFKTIFG